MRITITILLLLTVSVKTADKVYCKLAPLFGAKGLTKPEKHTHPKFCKTLKNTCCSTEDFEALQKYWEDSYSKMAMVEQRLIEMRTLLGKFKFMTEYQTEVTHRIKEIKEHKITGQPVCVSPAHILGNIYKLGLVKTAIKHYEESAEKCWTYTRELMTGLMCAVCDADNQDSFMRDEKEQKNNKITISFQECNLFTNHCLDHLKSIWALSYYLSYMNMLSQCSEDAEFNGKHEELLMSDTMIQTLNSCIHEKNLDDCASICRSQLNFSTQTRFEHDNIAKIIRFFRQIDVQFGEIAAKKRKDKEQKIIDDKKKKEEEEEKKKKIRKKRILTEEDIKLIEGAKIGEDIMQFKTEVKFKGLNVTHYTLKNNDGFESLNTSLLFEKLAGRISWRLMIGGFLMTLIFWM